MLTIYEAIILIRKLPKDALVESVKRTTGYIFQKGGFFRKIDYLGFRRVPYRLSREKNPCWEANYFFYEFNVPKASIPLIWGELMKDRAVIRQKIFPISYPPPEFDFDSCTFSDEMKPVPYRPQVIEMVRKAQIIEKRRNHLKFKMRNMSPFHPFQR